MLIMVSEGVASDTEATKGKYLQDFDPDANDGMGAVTWTTEMAKAKRFADMADALECWRAQSTKRPHRDDGRPNRPLTAYSVSFATPAGDSAP